MISCLRGVFFPDTYAHSIKQSRQTNNSRSSSSNKKNNNEAIFWRVTTHTEYNGCSNMDDSIINIDDESDSFSLSSDTDIRNIVDQWKQNHTTTDQKDLKFDTRTFTRPKKRLFTFPDGNNTMTFAESRERTSSDELSDEASTSTAGTPGTGVPKIDLKIGGLVTSLQRSMLGDVTPPSHMNQSMESSLITSSDFTNVNDFINDNAGDSLSMAHFKEYRLSDAINDRNFLERLTNYDESYFTKDADINNVDVNENGGDCTGSSSSTLHNSTDSSSCLGGSNNKFDGTFVATGNGPANGTFNASGGIEVDKTFIQAPNSANTSSIKNSTFELAPAASAAAVVSNRTFETQPMTMTLVQHRMGNDMPVPSLEDEELSLCDSFNGTKNLEYKNADVSAQSLADDLNSTFRPEESTPAAHNKRKSRKSEALAAISPILLETGKTRSANQNLTQNVDKFVDIEIEDMPVFLREPSLKSSIARASNPTGIDTERREKERRSLAKFEEFENTLMILENNKSEEEFDDLLNSFSANTRNPMSEKVRQSLDNLKKQIGNSVGGGGGGIEKQQQDELNHEKSITKSGKYSEFGGNAVRATEQIGRNGMMSSLMSSSSGSGNGERLLRRSRLFDDVNVMSLAPESNGDDMEYTDNKHVAELNSTQTLNRKNQMHLENDTTTIISSSSDTAKTDNNNISNYNTDEIPATAGGKANRDRFKTIRIFKKPPENAIQIPDPEEELHHTPEAMMQTPQYPSAIQRSATDAFATKNTNSPKHQQQQLSQDSRVAGEGDLNQFGAKKAAINTMTYKRSGLARPRQLSGLVKRDPYMKSSSHELLSSDQETTTSAATSRQMQSKPVPQLKSPMGIKSKSIHNLSTTRTSSMAKPTSSRLEYTAGIEQSSQQSTMRGQNLSSQTFKVPAPKSLVTMRARREIDQPQKLKLIRPSSGYFGYNSKRTDSDTDLGRFSSNNSLSSGSSKSSLSRGETPETFVSSTDNVNATFVQPSQVKTASTNVPASRQTLANGGAVSGIAQPRVSMLRPPTQIRRSALPRPSTAAMTKR